LVIFLLNALRAAVFHRLRPMTAIKLEFLWYNRRLPRLDPPVTFNEKIAYRKLYDRDPRLPRLADKVHVKEQIARLLGEQWVIPTLWTGDRLPPREERNWPIPYVLKANHGSGWNLFVRAKEDEDWDRIEKMTERWLRSTYGRVTKEWLYSEIKPRLLVEPFVSDDGEMPPDYKLFVFCGRTAMVQVDLGRMGNHRQYFYDAKWNRLKFTYVWPYEKDDILPPRSLDKLLWAASRLGDPFSFARIDFYEVRGEPLFGEFTFYPSGGRFPFNPESIELELGRLWPMAGQSGMEQEKPGEKRGIGGLLSLR